MSGGSYNYIYRRLLEDCEGRMYDAEMDDLIKDLCEVLHDLEWWQSCDSSEEKYRKTVSAFKKKWFTGNREQRLKEYIDGQISIVRSQLYSLIGEPPESEVKKMKVVIEVPKDQYEWIKEHKGETDYQTTEMLYNCVRKGTLVDEAEGCWISSYPDVESNPMFMYGTCSVCGFKQSISNKLKFCPNCGTKMSSEDEFDNLEEMLEDLWNATESESDKSADTFEKLLNSGFYEGFRKE